MKSSFRTGLSFGLTSGVITTLGLMVGLHSGTHSRTVVIGGIVTIAVADALSDALGIHIAEESKNNGVVSEIWESTIATFVAKFLIALTFVVPVLLLPLEQAMAVSVAWGLALLAGLSYFWRELSRSRLGKSSRSMSSSASASLRSRTTWATGFTRRWGSWTIKKLASLSCPFGLSGLSGFLVERSEPDEPDRRLKRDENLLRSGAKLPTEIPCSVARGARMESCVWSIE